VAWARCRGGTSVDTLSLSPAIRIYMATGTTDLRRSIDGLSALVRERVGLDLLSGHLFLFRIRRGDRLKIQAWDRSGFSILRPRLAVGWSASPSDQKPSSIDRNTDSDCRKALRTEGARLGAYHDHREPKPHTALLPWSSKPWREVPPSSSGLPLRAVRGRALFPRLLRWWVRCVASCRTRHCLQAAARYAIPGSTLGGQLTPGEPDDGRDCQHPRNAIVEWHDAIAVYHSLVADHVSGVGSR
jgi:transposase